MGIHVINYSTVISIIARIINGACRPCVIFGPLFIMGTDLLPQNLVKSRSRKIGCCNNRIALEFEEHLGGAAAEVPIRFQSEW